MKIESLADLLSLAELDEATSCLNLIYSTKSNGYPRVTFQGKVVRANRLSYVLSGRKLEEGELVCHSCDNTMCVNPEHLFAGSHAENMADMVNKGRSTRGEAHGRAKLTGEKVLEIRSCGLSNRAAARKYGVAACTIGEIMRREIWKHV